MIATERGLIRRRRETPAAHRSASAFNLVEILAALAIGGTLITLLTTSAVSALNQSKNTQCLAKIRQQGVAIQLYAQDNDGEFPRSNHSASRRREIEWSIALLPYLGHVEELSDEQAMKVFNTAFRCPADKSTNPYVWSYGMNVFFELDPTRDGYVGKPASWNRIVSVERPSKTILLAEPKGVSGGDHFMCHQWSSLDAAKNSVSADRHGTTSNFLFVDGHAESLPLEATFNPAKNLNQWNPSLAN